MDPAAIFDDNQHFGGGGRNVGTSSYASLVGVPGGSPSHQHQHQHQHQQSLPSNNNSHNNSSSPNKGSGAGGSGDGADLGHVNATFPIGYGANNFGAVNDPFLYPSGILNGNDSIYGGGVSGNAVNGTSDGLSPYMFDSTDLVGGGSKLMGGQRQQQQQQQQMSYNNHSDSFSPSNLQQQQMLAMQQQQQQMGYSREYAHAMSQRGHPHSHMQQQQMAYQNSNHRQNQFNVQYSLQQGPIDASKYIRHDNSRDHSRSRDRDRDRDRERDRDSSKSTPGTGGSNAQGRAINKLLLDLLRDRSHDPNRLNSTVDQNIEKMDCVNLSTLLFHTGKKRTCLAPHFIKRIAARFAYLKEDLRAREASNALYGLRCHTSDGAEIRQLVLALANKLTTSPSDFVAQAVGNALYGCQMMNTDSEEVRYLMGVLATKVSQCTELLEAQNVGNALYGLRGMNSDCKEIRAVIVALIPKVQSAREDLNGQALGNSLYGLQMMSSKEPEVRSLVAVLAGKAARCWEDLKAQEVGNALYGLKRMSSDIAEVRSLLDALVPKINSSPEILDAQAIGNSFYGMQNMKSDNPSVLSLLHVMSKKVGISLAELDGQAMGNSLYGLQGMSSDHDEVRSVVSALTSKIQASVLEMNAQELGNALYGLQNMSSDYPEVRKLLVALASKVAASKHDLTSQEIGNALFGLQGMRSDCWETCLLVKQLALKISKSHSLLDPQGIANSLFGLQKMSSECEDVRMLIQALATKIEQSWKFMNSQHIAYSLFGMQNMSSVEPEVNILIRVLIPKILNCRDEVNMKQMSYAIYGIQGMYCGSEDVRTLLRYIAEKIASSKDVINGTQLATILFGLQGLTDSVEEVQLLLKSIVEKAAEVVEIDAQLLSNCFFGLQRMSSTSPEMKQLLQILSTLFVNTFAQQQANVLAGRPNEFTAMVCANIIYGIQGCSSQEISVQNILVPLVQRIADITNFYKDSMQTGFLKGVTQGAAKSPSRLADLTTLYHSVTLSLLSLPHLDLNPETKYKLLDQQSVLSKIMDARKVEMKSALTLSPAQNKLSETMRLLLAKEPFQVTSGEVLFGFECPTVISLKPDIQLTTASGKLWNPTLVLEVSGPNYTFPSKDLFRSLTSRFFYETKGTIVDVVHSSTFVNTGNLYDVVRHNDGLLHCLHPPTTEDSAAFSKQLMSKGFYTCPNGIMSTVVMSDSTLFSYDGRFGSGPGVTFIPTSEYQTPTNSIHKPLKTQWVGEVPKLSAASALLVSQVFQQGIAGGAPISRSGSNSALNTPSGAQGGSSFGRIGNYTSEPSSPSGRGPSSPGQMARADRMSAAAGENGGFYNLASSPRGSSNSLSSYGVPSPNHNQSILVQGSSILGGLSRTSSNGDMFGDNLLDDSRHMGSLHTTLSTSTSASSFQYQIDTNDQESDKMSLKIGLSIADSPNSTSATSAPLKNSPSSSSSAAASTTTTTSTTTSASSSANISPASSAPAAAEDDEITILERKLEIARMEQRLAELKMRTKGSSPNSGSNP